MAKQEQWSQASLRSYRIFRDQHGREWGADIEDKTGHPCGPLALRIGPNQVIPPMKFPQKYFVDFDGVSGTFAIDYDSWLKGSKDAHTDYQLNMLREANRMYHDRAQQMIQAKDPALLVLVGREPPDPRQVMSARAGNKWVLGICAVAGVAPEKPKWADEVFPPPVEVGEMFSFPDAEDEYPDADSVSIGEMDGKRIEYPYMASPGRWWLDEAHRDAVLTGNEKTFQGTKQDARDAAELRVAESVGAGVDASWEKGG